MQVLVLIQAHTSAHCINRDQPLSQWPTALQVDWQWVITELLTSHLKGTRLLKGFENVWKYVEEQEWYIHSKRKELDNTGPMKPKI